MSRPPTLLERLLVFAAAISRSVENFQAFVHSSVRSFLDFLMRALDRYLQRFRTRAGVADAASTHETIGGATEGEAQALDAVVTVEEMDGDVADFGETPVPVIRNAAVEAAVQDVVSRHYSTASPSREAHLRRLVACLLDHHHDLTINIERLEILLESNDFDMEQTTVEFLRMMYPRPLSGAESNSPDR